MRAVNAALDAVPSTERHTLSGELAGLRHELRCLSMLLERAAGFHEEWARIRCIIASGYAPGCQPAAAETSRRLSVEA
jgi:hypothetical protein